jgi:hypothetical protein
MHASVHKLETHGFMRAPIIRTMMERMYLMYGSMGRFLRALLMAISSDATVASNALPKRSRWVGYSCALTCLAFVPFMFVGRVDLHSFPQPVGWVPLAIASGFRWRS